MAPHQTNEQMDADHLFLKNFQKDVRFSGNLPIRYSKKEAQGFLQHKERDNTMSTTRVQKNCSTESELLLISEFKKLSGETITIEDAKQTVGGTCGWYRRKGNNFTPLFCEDHLMQTVQNLREPEPIEV